MFDLTSILGIIICTTLIFLLVTVVILICHRHRYSSPGSESDEYTVPERIPGFNAPATSTTCMTDTSVLTRCDSLAAGTTMRCDVPPAYDSIILPREHGTGCDLIKVANTDETASELASMICRPELRHQISGHFGPTTPQTLETRVVSEWPASSAFKKRPDILHTCKEHRLPCAVLTSNNLPVLIDNITVTTIPTAPPRDYDSETPSE